MDSQEIFKEKMKQEIQYLEQETKQKINREIEHFINEVVNEVAKNESTVKQLTNIFNNNTEITDKVKIDNGRLSEKVFLNRNSLLTDLYNVKHIRTIYHIFVAMLVGHFIHNAMDEYMKNGHTTMGLDKLSRSFAKLDVAFTIWLIICSLILANYGLFISWANARINLLPNALKVKMFDYSCLMLSIMYYTIFVYYISKVVIKSDFPPPTASIVIAELIRFSMKTYAFLRSNIPKALNYKPHSEKENPYPPFSKYLYFLFAPTLIYRESYPRTRSTRWKTVLFYAVEFLAVIFFLNFVIERYFISVFKSYGKGKLNWEEAGLLVLGNSPAASAFMLGSFYSLLHVWLNASAEILTFGDKMFYKDWWNSTSYGAYYRKWNVVVHDWLYTYIYKDAYEILWPKNKAAAKFLVFFVSALVHEYILSLVFGFFFPILFLEFFGFGVALVFLNIGNNFFGNTFFWFTYSFGTCLSMCLYCMEYFVRVNCPIENPTLIDFFIPRLFTCNHL